MSVEGIKLDEQSLDALMELLHTFRLLQNYLNDQVVQDMSKLMMPLLRLLNAAVSTDLIDVFERGLQDPKLDKAILDPPKVGLGGLLKVLRDEDAQRGLGVLVELLKAIGRAAATKFPEPHL